MKLIKCGAIVAGTVAASVALMASVASATIAPNPYSTSVGSGSFTTTQFLGDSGCTLSGITGSATGSSGSVTGFTASDCYGLITSAGYNKPIAIRTVLATGGNPASVSAAVALLITNLLGGSCLYQGTLTGTPDGSDTVVLSGTLQLVTTLSGTCMWQAEAEILMTLPDARID